MNIRMQISLQDSDLVSFGHIPRSGIARLHGSLIFNFLRKCHTVLHSGSTNLHSQQQCTKGCLFSTSSLTLVISCFLDDIHFNMNQWYLIVVLICMVAISMVFHSTGAIGEFFSTTSVKNLSVSLQKMGSGLVGPCMHTAPSDHLSWLTSDCNIVVLWKMVEMVRNWPQTSLLTGANSRAPGPAFCGMSS